jgi:molybdopterin synthase catalytic subunit
MDYLKTRAPFWKQVETASGKTWVNAKTADNVAAERWEVQRRERETAE